QPVNGIGAHDLRFRLVFGGGGDPVIERRLRQAVGLSPVIINQVASHLKQPATQTPARRVAAAQGLYQPDKNLGGQILGKPGIAGPQPDVLVNRREVIVVNLADRGVVSGARPCEQAIFSLKIGKDEDNHGLFPPGAGRTADRDRARGSCGAVMCCGISVPKPPTTLECASCALQQDYPVGGQTDCPQKQSP